MNPKPIVIRTTSGREVRVPRIHFRLMGASLGVIAVATASAAAFKLVGIELPARAIVWFAFLYFVALSYSASVTMWFFTGRWVKILCLPI